MLKKFMGTFVFVEGTYIDTRIETTSDLMRTVCLEIYTKVSNQRANILNFASWESGFRIYLWNGKLRFELWENDDNYLRCSHTLQINTWTRICATQDGSTMKLYVHDELLCNLHEIFLCLPHTNISQGHELK